MATVYFSFAFANALPGSDPRFGNSSSSSYWLDNVRCHGNETNIAHCNHRGWGIENCDRHQAAKVICACKFIHVSVAILLTCSET